MKNSNDTIGSRTRDLPACSAVPQPTAPPRAPHCFEVPSQYFYIETYKTPKFFSADRGLMDGTRTRNVMNAWHMCYLIHLNVLKLKFKYSNGLDSRLSRDWLANSIFVSGNREGQTHTNLIYQ
jgi:hypothetical protein